MYDDSIGQIVLLLHLATTWFMVGVIWFVQIVHYPLMATIGREQFVQYEQTHTRRTGWVLAPPMIVEFGTGLLLMGFRPTGVTLVQTLVGVALLVVIWISTHFIQVPCHNRLCIAFDSDVHRRLVSTNWVRTVAWSLRGLVIPWMVLTCIYEVRR